MEDIHQLLQTLYIHICLGLLVSSEGVSWCSCPSARMNNADYSIFCYRRVNLWVIWNIVGRVFLCCVFSVQDVQHPVLCLYFLQHHYFIFSSRATTHLFVCLFSLWDLQHICVLCFLQIVWSCCVFSVQELQHVLHADGDLDQICLPCHDLLCHSKQSQWNPHLRSPNSLLEGDPKPKPKPAWKLTFFIMCKCFTLAGFIWFFCWYLLFCFEFELFRVQPCWLVL